MQKMCTYNILLFCFICHLWWKNSALWNFFFQNFSRISRMPLPSPHGNAGNWPPTFDVLLEGGVVAGFEGAILACQNFDIFDTFEVTFFQMGVVWRLSAEFRHAQIAIKCYFFKHGWRVNGWTQKVENLERILHFYAKFFGFVLYFEWLERLNMIDLGIFILLCLDQSHPRIIWLVEKAANEKSDVRSRDLDWIL